MYSIDRRWKRSYSSFSRKRKDTIIITNEMPNDTDKNILMNSNNDDDDNGVDNINNNNINKTGSDEHCDELPYVSIKIYYPFYHIKGNIISHFL